MGWLGSSNSFVLPYLGFDWYPNDEWVVSMLLPWPSVVWAPSEDWLIRFGATQSDASWQFRSEGEERDADLSRMQLGVSYERRLKGSFWGGFGVGRSGFGRLRVSEDDVDLDTDITRETYFELFINFRPDS